MLDRFTDRARKVMSMAKQEALDLHSNKVGTEHLLLALAKEDEGIAAEALRSLDISYDDFMDTLKEVQTTVPEPSEETEAAKLAFTPLVISVMERSFRVARENNQTYVSTAHLLIGIVEEGNGMAMDILMRLGVSSASIKKAIEKLTAGVLRGDKAQTLLGVTGSGKTFTMANIIANTGRPTLVLAHNKTLAAQLCTEIRSIFPENAVEYFVSYYD